MCSDKSQLDRTIVAVAEENREPEQGMVDRGIAVMAERNPGPEQAIGIIDSKSSDPVSRGAGSQTLASDRRMALIGSDKLELDQWIGIIRSDELELDRMDAVKAARNPELEQTTAVTAERNLEPEKTVAVIDSEDRGPRCVTDVQNRERDRMAAAMTPGRDGAAQEPGPERAESAGRRSRAAHSELRRQPRAQAQRPRSASGHSRNLQTTGGRSATSNGPP